MLIFLFFLLSLGTMAQLSLGSMNYNVLYIEVGLVAILIYIFYTNIIHNSRELKPLERLSILFKTAFDRQDKSYYRLICLMGIYSIVTVFWSPFGASSLLATITYMYMIILFFLFKFINLNIEVYFNANRVLLLSLTFQVLVSFIINDASSVIGYYDLKHIASALLGNSNYLAVFIGFIFVSEVISKRKYWLVFSFVSGLMIILTLSKTAIIAISISLFVYFSFHLTEIISRSLKKVVLGFVLSFVLILVIVTKTKFGNIFFYALYNSLSTGYLSGRELLIQESIKNILQYPMGMGYSIIEDPHNTFLISIRSFGMLFGIVAIYIFIKPLISGMKKKVLRMTNITQSLYFGYLTVLIHSMFEIFFFTNAATIWFTVTIILLEREMRNEYSSGLEL